MAHRSPNPAPLLTIEEFALLPNESFRLELVRGRVIREPPASYEHGRLGIRIGSLLERFVREHLLGEVVGTGVGFVLSEDPPTVRAPDLAFIAASRIPAEGGRTGFARVVPDLVIEIISPSNTAAEIRARVYDYLDAGTRLVWALEPGARRVTVYSSAEEIRVLGERDELDGGEVLPGFRVEVLEVFKR